MIMLDYVKELLKKSEWRAALAALSIFWRFQEEEGCGEFSVLRTSPEEFRKSAGHCIDEAFLCGYMVGYQAKTNERRDVEGN